MTSARLRCVRGLLVAAVVPSLLQGCTGSDEAAYCTALRGASSQWAQAGASLEDKAAATRFVSAVKAVEATAPEEVRPQWVALQTLFEKFEADRPDLSAVTAEMKDFEAAAKRIEVHAKETCGIDLGA
jgi:hypothetical protein